MTNITYKPHVVRPGGRSRRFALKNPRTAQGDAAVPRALRPDRTGRAAWCALCRGTKCWRPHTKAELMERVRRVLYFETL